MSLKTDTTATNPTAPVDGVEELQRLVREQQQTIQAQQKIIAKLEQQLRQQRERIEQLEAHIREQKKLKGKPKLTPSKLNEPQTPEPLAEKRAGSDKRSKKKGFEVDEERIIEPSEIPDGAQFNGYRVYDVQELEIRRYNIRFLLAEYVTLDGKMVAGELPSAYRGSHYGPELVTYVLSQHYQCRVPQPLIYEQLQEWDIDISVGQVNRLLTEKREEFAQEQEEVLRVGLETAVYIQTDDTGARHQGKNGYCTVVGNQWFAYFKSSDSKSRENFLSILQGENVQYVLNEYSRQYLEEQKLATKYWALLTFSDEPLAEQKSDWQSYLLAKGIVSINAIRIISDAALLGGLMARELKEPLLILSDGAGQFNVMRHGLCWVHAERSLRKLEGSSAQQRQDITEMQDMLWQYYQELKQYKQQPTNERKDELWQEFDRIFSRCYINNEGLNSVLNQMRGHKAELLQVLDCPQIPLHNNDSETNIREYVTRRKISGGTRSKLGRKARDAFVGLKKTCRKLGISFWHYLLSRLRADGQIPPLPDVIRDKASAALQVAIAT